MAVPHSQSLDAAQVVAVANCTNASAGHVMAGANGQFLSSDGLSGAELGQDKRATSSNRERSKMGEKQRFLQFC